MTVAWDEVGVKEEFGVVKMGVSSVRRTWWACSGRSSAHTVQKISNFCECRLYDTH